MSLKLETLIRIFEFLNETEWRSAASVARKFSVDHRTVIRYMNEIEAAFSPMPVLERGREGYRLRRNDFIEELEARKDYAGLAAVVSTPLGGMVSRGRIPESLSSTLRGMVEVKSTLPEDIMRKSFDAMRSGQYLDLSYRAKLEEKAHRFAPIKFFMSSGIPYLVGLDEGYGHMICLGADKIEKASKARKFLSPDEMSGLREYLNGAWGMMIKHRDGSRTRVGFKASPSVAAYFIKEPMHSTQEVVEEGGRYSFAIVVHNEDEFARFLLRFGRAARIVEPESAVAAARGFLDAMRDFYDSGGRLEP